jgi:uncharacterized protein
MIHGSLALANADRVIRKVRKTTNFLERMRGLLGTKNLDNDEGLLIAPCSSVHTFGMRYSIDVLFLDKQFNIVKAVKSLKPWRMAGSNLSSMVLELADDNINKLQLKTGQQLEWHDDYLN